MFRFLCRGVGKPNELLFNEYLTKIWCFLETPVLIRCLSTTTNQKSLTVSYLIGSCGFPEDKAIAISKKVQFDSSSKPDSVISLLKNYGLPTSYISNLVTRYPRVLVSDADKIIKPKIEHLKSLGFCGPNLVKVLSFNLFVLNSSLENRIIPNIVYLKSFVTTDSNMATLLSRSSWILKLNVEKLMAPNIALLRANGVPDSYIEKIVVQKPIALMRGPDQFKEIVEEIKKMKFNPLLFSFAKGIVVLTQLSKSSWEAKFSIYRKYGWSKEVFYMAFRSQPKLMEASAKKIEDTLEFLVNKMGYDPLLIAEYPTIITFSLDKRIIPRCLVFELLVSEGLIGKEYNISSILTAYNEKDFVEKFVTKFQDKIPKVLDVYQGKVKDFEETKELC
ncbi:hypothetical protein ACHQM5_021396 [Ranunculus cassubicifolius]